MKIPTLPFTLIDWPNVAPVEHAGVTGKAIWRVFQVGDLRIRHVEYTPGYLADLNVIDPDRLNLGPPEIVQDLPAGGTRLLQPARGYLWTVKSGVPTFENGVWTGQTPGGLLRGDRPRPQQ